MAIEGSHSTLPPGGADVGCTRLPSLRADSWACDKSTFSVPWSPDSSFSGGVWCTTIAADCRSSECRAAHSGGSGQSSIQGKRMTRRNTLLLAAASLLVLGTGSVPAQEVKVGVNLPYTGIGAEFAQLIDRGMELYLKLNADKVKPYKISLIKRDVKDPGGANAKIAVQELLTQDNVDVLAGWIYSPNAIASAPIVTAGKKLAVIMNAGTAHITTMSPYYVRTSFSMWHAGYALGDAAAKLLHAKTAVVGYSDFPPGKDSLAAFKRAFEASGGKVVDEIPMGGPAQVPDFTPFFQRAKDKKPDVFFVFVPAGDHALAVTKTYGALGM